MTEDKQLVMRSIKIDKKHISYMRWLLESHDGIANPTTRQDADNIIDLTIMRGFLDDAEALIDALCEETGAERVEAPESSPLLN